VNAVLAYIDTGDREVSLRLADWSPPRWVLWWMLAATRLGDGWLWAFIALALLAVGDYGALATAGLACSGTNVALIFLKRKFRRSRPCANQTNHFFQMVKADLSSFDSFSFPSGHTMNAFAIGTVLSSLHPALFPAMLFVAMSVGASRIVLRLHFLTDVLAGAVLGVAIGSLVCRALA
jgi:undecaprenyl-diphosphatase